MPQACGWCHLLASSLGVGVFEKGRAIDASKILGGSSAIDRISEVYLPPVVDLVDEMNET